MYLFEEKTISPGVRQYLKTEESGGDLQDQNHHFFNQKEEMILMIVNLLRAKPRIFMR